MLQLIEPEIIKKYEEKDKQVCVHAQRVGAILNANEEDRKNSGENWQKADPDIKRVGCIPRIVWNYLETLGITKDANELMRYLELHPEYKTTEKRLI